MQFAYKINKSSRVFQIFCKKNKPFRSLFLQRWLSQQFKTYRCILLPCQNCAQIKNIGKFTSFALVHFLGVFLIEGKRHLKC